MNNEFVNNPNKNVRDCCSYEKLPFDSERIENMVKKRNYMLLVFMETFAEQIFDTSREKIESIKLIGDPNRPVVVFNNAMILSLYIRNFSISFLKEFQNHDNNHIDAVYSEDLNVIADELTDLAKVAIESKIRNLSSEFAFRELYKISVGADGLYYNSLKNMDLLASESGCRLFFSFQKAKAELDRVQAKIDTKNDLRITNSTSVITTHER